MALLFFAFTPSKKTPPPWRSTSRWALKRTASIYCFIIEKAASPCYTNSMNAAKIVQAAKILKDAGCSEIYIFGSQATGRVNENSDLDLGVRGLPQGSFFGIHYDLERALQMPVDLVDFDFQKDFFELLRRVGELKQIG